MGHSRDTSRQKIAILPNTPLAFYDTGWTIVVLQIGTVTEATRSTETRR